MIRVFVLILLARLDCTRSSGIIDLACKTDPDCAAFQTSKVNATCEQDQCKCINTLGNSVVECVPTTNRISNQIGGQCPCQAANSYCNEQTQLCICKDGFLPSRVGKKCIPKSVKLGDECEQNEQCLRHSQFSKCNTTEHKCDCLPHFAIYESSCHSVIATNLTKPCESEHDCSNLTANTRCHEGQCICDTGYVGDASNGHCLPVAGIDQPCQDSNQCVATLGVGSLCYQDKCACESHHYQYTVPGNGGDGGDGHPKDTKIRTICEQKIVHGDTCNDNKDCYQFHRGPHEQTMECILNQCVCLNGYTEKNDICYKTSEAATIFISSVLLALLIACVTCSNW